MLVDKYLSGYSCLMTFRCHRIVILLSEIVYRVMYKENLNWNSIHKKHNNSCLSLIHKYDFKSLKLQHELILKVLLSSVLSRIGRFSESMNVYNLKTKRLKPIAVYKIPIPPLGALQDLFKSCTKV